MMKSSIILHTAIGEALRLDRAVPLSAVFVAFCVQVFEFQVFVSEQGTFIEIHEIELLDQKYLRLIFKQHSFLCKMHTVLQKLA